MKTNVPLLKVNTILQFTVFAIVFFISILPVNVNAQSSPELIFRNPVLENGVDKQDGAEYRFSNVMTGIDAVLIIKGRSASNVVINNIDLDYYGWDKAFQPEMGMTGNAPANTNWWVDFNIGFYTTGTNIKAKVSQFAVTGIDIDGDGQKLNEWIEMYKVNKKETAVSSMLLVNTLASYVNTLIPNESDADYRINGPVTNFTDIDTNAVATMITYTYKNKKDIDFRIGAKTGSSSSSAAMRLNSLWFKEFNLTLNTLPVEMYSFNAMLENNKVSLNWVTASEINVSHFNIEKSFDGKSFNQEGIVMAFGNTSAKQKYTFTDDITKSSARIIYYRLKIQDADGKFSYSDVRMVRISEQKETMALSTYPNPVSNEVRVTIPSAWQNKKVVYEMYNAAGKLIKTKSNENSGQTETIAMNDVSKGFYIVRAVMENETAQQKIIKN